MDQAKDLRPDDHTENDLDHHARQWQPRHQGGNASRNRDREGHENQILSANFLHDHNAETRATLRWLRGYAADLLSLRFSFMSVSSDEIVDHAATTTSGSCMVMFRLRSSFPSESEPSWGMHYQSMETAGRLMETARVFHNRTPELVAHADGLHDFLDIHQGHGVGRVL